MRISDWSSDVCSSDLDLRRVADRDRTGRGGLREAEKIGVVGREPEETAQRQAVLAGGLAVHAGGGAELAGGVAGDAQGDCAKSRALRAAAPGERPGTAGVRVDPDRDRVAAGGMGGITQ